MNKLLVAMITVLSLTACQNAEEAAAPVLEQVKKAVGAAADTAGQAAGDTAAGAAATAVQGAADVAAGAGKVQEMANKAKDAAQR